MICVCVWWGGLQVAQAGSKCIQIRAHTWNIPRTCMSLSIWSQERIEGFMWWQRWWLLHLIWPKLYRDPSSKRFFPPTPPINLVIKVTCRVESQAVDSWCQTERRRIMPVPKKAGKTTFSPGTPWPVSSYRKTWSIYLAFDFYILIIRQVIFFFVLALNPVRLSEEHLFASLCFHLI